MTASPDRDRDRGDPPGDHGMDLERPAPAPGGARPRRPGAKVGPGGVLDFELEPPAVDDDLDGPGVGAASPGDPRRANGAASPWTTRTVDAG